MLVMSRTCYQTRAKPSKETNAMNPALREWSDIAALVGTVMGSVLEGFVPVARTLPVAVPLVAALFTGKK